MKFANNREESVTLDAAVDIKSVTEEILQIANTAKVDIGEPANPFEELATALSSSASWKNHEDQLRLRAEKLCGTLLYVDDDADLTVANYQAAKALQTALFQVVHSLPGLPERSRVTVSAEFPRVEQLQVHGDGRVKAVLRGRVAQTLDLFRANLASVDFRRLGQCPECETLYWRSRTAQATCSRRCKQRKWRREHPERWQAITIEVERRRAEREMRKNK